MIAEAPKPDALLGIYKLMKKAFVNCWDDVVAEQRPFIELIMTQDGHSDPLRAVVPYVSDMEKRGQDPSLIIAVAYELKLKRKNDVVKNRKSGWTL
jgi:hypothetical protein